MDKCKYHNKADDNCLSSYRNWKKCHSEKCPAINKNTVTESKYITIKAWAWFWGIPGSIAGGLCANTVNHGNAKKFPCEIRIDRKHLGGK